MPVEKSFWNRTWSEQSSFYCKQKRTRGIPMRVPLVSMSGERKTDPGSSILDPGSSILDKGKDNAKTEIRDSRIAENPGTGIREP
jgi:hypothetical protein